MLFFSSMLYFCKYGPTRIFFNMVAWFSHVHSRMCRHPHQGRQLLLGNFCCETNSKSYFCVYHVHAMKTTESAVAASGSACEETPVADQLQEVVRASPIGSKITRTCNSLNWLYKRATPVLDHVWFRILREPNDHLVDLILFSVWSSRMPMWWSNRTPRVSQVGRQCICDWCGWFAWTIYLTSSNGKTAPQTTYN